MASLTEGAPCLGQVGLRRGARHRGGELIGAVNLVSSGRALLLPDTNVYIGAAGRCRPTCRR